MKHTTTLDTELDKILNSVRHLSTLAMTEYDFKYGDGSGNTSYDIVKLRAIENRGMKALKQQILRSIHLLGGSTMTAPKHTAIEEILKAYADMDDTELGEDRFIGHHDLQKATQSIESLIKEQKLQLLKEVEGCVPVEKNDPAIGSFRDPWFNGEMEGWNSCRTQIIKSIKELKGES